MSCRPSKELSMKIAGDNYHVYSIRKKTTKTYNWQDPADGGSHDWKIIECYANNAKDKEEEYQSMRGKQQYEPVIVEFRDQTINEIYFNGSFHVVRPNDNPDIEVSTTDQVLANFEQFVSANFRNTAFLDDIHKGHAHAPH